MEDDSADDSQQTLSQIAQKHGRSIVDMLIDIQDCAVPQSKSLRLLERLECIQLIDYPYDNPPRNASTGEIIPPRSADDPAVEYRFMRRRHVNILRDFYITVSYTWLPQDGEDLTSGRYWIEHRQKIGFDVSPVRNTVLDRIISAAKGTVEGTTRPIPPLWIDQHCISQTTTCTSADCIHEDCREKRDAVHAMDVVYSQSSLSFAPVSCYFDSKDDIILLIDMAQPRELESIMEPDHPTDGNPSYRIPTKAILAIKLAHDIISDPWWTRAWTFQERILSRSYLLFRYAPSLEDSIPTWTRTCGYIKDQLAIPSNTFSTPTYVLCEKVLQELNKLAEGDLDTLRDDEKHLLGMIHRIKEAIAGSAESDATIRLMPEIVEKKGIAKLWDRLAIISNCCRFSSRLEPLELLRQGHSISVSTLALFLLNGEVLDNQRERTTQKASNTSVSRYIATQFLDNRKSVPWWSRDCRLSDVVLTTQGLRTRGHLWRLGGEFKLELLSERPSWKEIVEAFQNLGYTALATNIQEALEYTGSRSSRSLTSQLSHCHSVSHKSYMRSIEPFLRHRCPIRLGRIWTPNQPDDKSLYLAIFAYARKELTCLLNYTDEHYVREARMWW